MKLKNKGADGTQTEENIINKINHPKQKVFQRLKKIHQQRKTLVLITHLANVF